MNLISPGAQKYRNVLSRLDQQTGSWWPVNSGHLFIWVQQGDNHIVDRTPVPLVLHDQVTWRGLYACLRTPDLTHTITVPHGQLATMHVLNVILVLLIIFGDEDHCIWRPGQFPQIRTYARACVCVYQVHACTHSEGVAPSQYVGRGDLEEQFRRVQVTPPHHPAPQWLLLEQQKKTAGSYSLGMSNKDCLFCCKTFITVSSNEYDPDEIQIGDSSTFSRAYWSKVFCNGKQWSRF